MKRRLLLLLALCLTLCSCENGPNTETTEQDPTAEMQVENPKGSPDNPYRVGETIVIDEMYPSAEHPANQIPFRMELTVTEAYSPEESASARIKKQVPAARLTLTFTGNYDEPMELDKFFYRPLLTPDMEKTWPLLFSVEDPAKELTALEMETEYDLLLTTYLEDNDAPVTQYPYLMISYYFPDCNTINDIYIDLTTGYQKQPTTETSSLSPAEQAQYYQAAVAAEKKSYYTVAKNLYESIPGYKDANLRLQSVLDILSPYNGTYYGQSHVHEGTYVWMYVQDGIVRITYDVENTPVLEYEIYQHGIDPDGTPWMAFAPSLTRFFLDNQNASYTHGFTMDRNEDLWTIAVTDGGHDQSWNSTLEKVSDGVDVQFDR